VLLKAGCWSAAPTLRRPPEDDDEVGKTRGYVAADPLSSMSCSASLSFSVVKRGGGGGAAKNPASRLCADARSDALAWARFSSNEADFFPDRRRGRGASFPSRTDGLLVPGTLRATLRSSPRSEVEIPNRGSSLLDWDADDSDDLHPPPPPVEAADPDRSDRLLLLLFLGEGGGDDAVVVRGRCADDERLPFSPDEETATPPLALPLVLLIGFAATAAASPPPRFLPCNDLPNRGLGVAGVDEEDGPPYATCRWFTLTHDVSQLGPGIRSQEGRMKLLPGCCTIVLCLSSDVVVDSFTQQQQEEGLELLAIKRLLVIAVVGLVRSLTDEAARFSLFG
jgi:hypothetical protein